MPAAGVHIVPLMSATDVIGLGVEAERLGYDYCMIADEGLHPDIYACLAAVARETERITLGVMTNPYTRHPGVTAAALATVNELSGGRVVVCMLTGGSMVLGPLAIGRNRPHRTMADAIEVMTRLWAGEEVSWRGETCGLDQARLGLGRQEIPIWVAGRGPMVLGLAGERADSVVLTVKPDLDSALPIVHGAAAAADRVAPQPIYLGRICYTPELLEGQRRTLSFVLMDSPRRVLESLGMTGEECDLVGRAARTSAPGLVDPLVTDELLRRYQVAGTPEECAAEIVALAAQHDLHAVLIDALSADFDENLAILRDSLPIITGTRP